MMAKKTPAKPVPASKAEPKSAGSGELSETDLDRIAGGKHPAKVTVPDIKLG
jgi:hypothetical protein